LQKDIQELVEANVISPEIANAIQDYYIQKEESSPNKLVIVFGILGALLVGLGIILIIAHNWDTLSRGIKTFLGFYTISAGSISTGIFHIQKEGK
jgi:uncharacterized membrane protein